MLGRNANAEAKCLTLDLRVFYKLI